MSGSIAGVKDAGALKSGMGTKGELSRQLTNTKGGRAAGGGKGGGYKMGDDDDSVPLFHAFSEVASRLGIFGIGFLSIARALGFVRAPETPIIPSFSEASEAQNDPGQAKRDKAIKARQQQLARDKAVADKKNQTTGAKTTTPKTPKTQPRAGSPRPTPV